jgi:hypothetical protein
VKRKTVAEWDKDIIAGFPVGLYMQPVGANRRQRRASREHKNGPMPPSSLRPAVRRLNQKTGKVEYVAAY